MKPAPGRPLDRATEPAWWRAEYGTRHWICLDETSARALVEGIVLERVMAQARQVVEDWPKETR